MRNGNKFYLPHFLLRLLRSHTHTHSHTYKHTHEVEEGERKLHNKLSRREISCCALCVLFGKRNALKTKVQFEGLSSVWAQEESEERERERERGERVKSQVSSQFHMQHLSQYGLSVFLFSSTLNFARLPQKLLNWWIAILKAPWQLCSSLFLAIQLLPSSSISSSPSGRFSVGLNAFQRIGNTSETLCGCLATLFGSSRISSYFIQASRLSLFTFSLTFLKRF